MKSILAGLAACFLLTACSSSEEPPAPQAVPVKTVTVARQAVPNVIELPGRVEPVRTAEVRARVTGIVQARLYEEGTDIRAGQPLFRIDPRELRASYAQTQAALTRARATAANARAVVERYRPLVEENAISGQEYDAALAAAIRLLRDVNIIEKFTDVKQDSYSKNRLGQGPTKFYENAPVIKGDKADVDRITNHVLGDACTPGNAKECTFDTVRPVVEHCMNGDLDELLP